MNSRDKEPVMRRTWIQLSVGLLAGGLAAIAVGQWNMSRLRRADDRFRQSLEAQLADRDARGAATLALAAAHAGSRPVEAPALAPSPTQDKATASTQPTKVPSREEIWRDAQVNVQRHNAESVDRSWAERVTPALESDMKRAMGLAKLTGTISNLECRATSCLGTVRWPALANVRREALQLLTADARVNCARSLIVPPDATDEGAPVEAEVLFDCAGWKQAGSDIAPI
jgi:hypothetical protein